MVLVVVRRQSLHPFCLVNLAGRAPGQARMRPLGIVVTDPPQEPGAGLKCVRVTHLYFRLCHSRSMNMLSIQHPRPLMEMRTPAAFSTSANSNEVNGLSWSEFNILGRTNHTRAFLQRLDAELYVRGVRHPTGQHFPGRPVHHRDPVKKATPRSRYGQIRCSEFGTVSPAGW